LKFIAKKKFSKKYNNTEIITSNFTSNSNSLEIMIGVAAKVINNNFMKKKKFSKHIRSEPNNTTYMAAIEIQE
jgi:lipoate synthase